MGRQTWLSEAPPVMRQGAVFYTARGGKEEVFVSWDSDDFYVPGYTSLMFLLAPGISC